MSPKTRSRVEGFIPTGWYPTAVRALPIGTLVVLNGSGLRSYPNPGTGRIPRKRAEPVHAGGHVPPDIVGRMQTGTASWIDPFTDEQLDEWTADRRWPTRAYRDATSWIARQARCRRSSTSSTSSRRIAPTIRCSAT